MDEKKIKSQNIKMEILSTFPKRKEKAESLMFLAFCLLKTKKDYSKEKVFVLNTKHIAFLDALYGLIQKYTSYDFYLDIEAERLFCENPKQVQALYQGVEHMDFLLKQEVLSSQLKMFFLRLCFYFWGSFSYTEKNKKVECRFPKAHKETLELFKKCLTSLDLPFFIGTDEQKVYFQKNESLSLFFAYLKLPQTLLELENEWIRKEMNQNIQRGINFDDANLKRQAKASEQLMEVFLKYLEAPSFHALSEEEQKLVLLRLQHEDYSLAELAQHTVPPKTKSQLHYALMKIKNKLESEVL